MKRSIDYDALYQSNKLASLPSDELRAEYLWILGLAGPLGTFEWNPRTLWAKAYAGVRDKNLEDVKSYLEALKAGGLLFQWSDGSKTYGYFTGSEKPGRLPRESWRNRFEKTRHLGPEPPADKLAAYISEHSGTAVACSDTETACKGRADGVIEYECEYESECECEDETEAAKPASKHTPVFSLPLRGGKEKQLYQDDVAELLKTYPSTEVLSELRKARAWLLANPSRQKTERGIRAFIVNWLNRAPANSRIAMALPLNGDYEKGFADVLNRPEPAWAKEGA